MRDEMRLPFHRTGDHYIDTTVAGTARVSPRLMVLDPRIPDAWLAAAPPVIDVEVPGGATQRLPFAVFCLPREQDTRCWQEKMALKYEMRAIAAGLESGICAAFGLAARTDFSIAPAGSRERLSFRVHTAGGRAASLSREIGAYARAKAGILAPGRFVDVRVGPRAPSSR